MFKNIIVALFFLITSLACELNTVFIKDYYYAKNINQIVCFACLDEIGGFNIIAFLFVFPEL